MQLNALFMGAPKRKVVIGSRGSDLALWQANHVKKQLEGLGCSVEISIIKTQGDKIQHLGFDKLEGKGFFTKEIEAALLSGKVDLAVHSHKDLETTPPAGLTVAAVSARENPAELLLIRQSAYDAKLPFGLKKGALVGTSSARRKCFLRGFRSDVELKDLRGNVPTRVQKLRDGGYDAIMLAAAGVARLKLDVSDFVVQQLDPRVFVPAPAQGVLALQVRSNDTELSALLSRINNEKVAACIGVERTILNLFEGGCQLPLGAFCRQQANGQFELWAAAAGDWQGVPVRIHLQSGTTDELAAQATNLLRERSQKRVFISRDLASESPFARHAAAKGYVVSGQSLIAIQPVALADLPSADWYFFTSPSGVTALLQQHTLPQEAQVGCIGEGTAARLRDAGIEPDFVGDAPTTEAVGNAFATVASGTVVFPVGSSSLRTVQQALPKAITVVDVHVYQTELAPPAELPQADVYVFTSPSNVQAFTAAFPIPSEAVLVAMGKATAAALAELGYQSLLPWAPTELALVDVLP